MVSFESYMVLMKVMNLKITINPFVPNALFLYILRTSENRFSDVFRG